MNIDEIRTLGTDCYAAFNQRAPEWSSKAWTLWAEMCASVPLEASVWIRGRIIELDSMPRNFGKAVKGLAADWRSAHGKHRETIVPCPECDTKTPGFFTVWRHDGSRVLVRCACNRDCYFDPMPCMTRSMAEKRVYDEQQGLRYIVPPADAPLVAFERKQFGDGPERADTRFGAMSGQLARNPVGPEKARKAHAAALAEYDDAVPF